MNSNKLLTKIVNILKSKKQIIFALFALLIYYIFNNDVEVLKSAVPVAVAAAGKAALAAAKAGAIKGAASGAIEGAANADEGESKLGSAAKGAVGGAAKGAASGAVTGAAGSALDSAKAAANAKNAANASGKTPQGSAINATKTTPRTENNTINNVKEKPKEMDSASSKEAQKEASKSDTEKDKKNSKGNRMDPDQEGKEEENTTDMDEASSTVLKQKPGTAIVLGCLFGPLITLALVIPLLASQLVSPVSKVLDGLDCETSGSIICEASNKFKEFSEKAKNFIKYGRFDTANNIILSEMEETYAYFYEKYEVKIDIPLLLSSLFNDAFCYEDEITGKLSYDLNKDLKKRLEYSKDLAKKQIVEYETIYICRETEDGFDKDLQGMRKMEDEEIEQNVTDCGEDGEYVYEYSMDLDLDGYYDRLRKKPEILGKIYGEEAIKTENALESLIQDIELETELFKILYDDYEIENASPGNVPDDLTTDETISFRSPINGNSSITSYYGARSTINANGITVTGRHNGIDVVAINDTNIYSAGNGIVTRANTETLGGNVVEITHTTSNGNVYITQYAHLNRFNVSVGDTVTSGQKIGVMGSTGAATGPHLHFQVCQNSCNQSNIIYNPLNVFENASNYSGEGIE